MASMQHESGTKLKQWCISVPLILRTFLLVISPDIKDMRMASIAM